MPIGAHRPVGNKAEGRCRPGAVALHEYIIGRWGAGVGSFGCYNPTSRAGSGWSLHREGRAIDVSIASSVRSKGDEIFGWVIANADPLGLQEIQWYGRIWTSRRSQEGIRTDTSSARNLHFDHLHIGLADGYTFTPPGNPPSNPRPSQEEDDLTPEQARQLDEVYNAIKNNTFGVSMQSNSVETLAKTREIHGALLNNVFGASVQALVAETALKVRRLFSKQFPEG